MMAYLIVTALMARVAGSPATRWWLQRRSRVRGGQSPRAAGLLDGGPFVVRIAPSPEEEPAALDERAAS